MDQWGWDRADVAEAAGVSQIYVTNRLKLLDLRPDVQKLVSDGQLKVGYAQVMSDHGLDRNRQLIALRKLRQNPAPTRKWFRGICGELEADQRQTAMFSDLDYLNAQQVIEETEAEEIDWPPHPSSDSPNVSGGSLREIAKRQVEFWSDAAREWEKWGKSNQADDCRSAAQAIEGLLNVTPRPKVGGRTLGLEDAARIRRERYG
jgi:hypothetical protein